MALGSCLSCVKYLMFIFNFVFWLAGCAILAIGIWTLVDPGARLEMNVIDQYYKVSAYVLIGIGSLIMVVGFLGCCGAIRESQCMLATFFVFLFIIFAFLLTIGVYFIIRRTKPEAVKDRVRDLVMRDLENAVRESTTNPSEKARMDSIQNAYSCCGFDKGKADYASPTDLTCNRLNYDIPCTPKIVDKLSENLQKYSVIVAGVALGIGVIMLLGMIFSMMLCCAIRDNMDY